MIRPSSSLGGYYNMRIYVGWLRTWNCVYIGVSTLHLTFLSTFHLKRCLEITRLLSQRRRSKSRKAPNNLDRPTCAAHALFTYSGVLAYACTIPSTIVCGLVLIAYGIAALSPVARTCFDRVSFRLLVYSLTFK